MFKDFKSNDIQPLENSFKFYDEKPQRCAAEEALRNAREHDISTQSVMISCRCPKCTIRYM